MMLSQHAMHQPITGFESDAIPTFNAAKIPPIKEPEEDQKTKEGEGKDFCGSLT